MTTPYTAGAQLSVPRVKAIETQYKGYRFRSRLEARWAVFFDTLGLKWEYEPEGFELGNGVRYLPDFLLRVGGAMTWIEVKPVEPSEAELRKAKLLVGDSHRLIILIGPPTEEHSIAVIPYVEEGANTGDVHVSRSRGPTHWGWLRSSVLPQAYAAARAARFGANDYGTCR